MIQMMDETCLVVAIEEVDCLQVICAQCMIHMQLQITYGMTCDRCKEVMEKFATNSSMWGLFMQAHPSTSIYDHSNDLQSCKVHAHFFLFLRFTYPSCRNICWD